jgi:predicted ATPase
LDTLKKIIVEERKEGDKSRLALALQQMGIAEARFDLQAGLPYLLESLAIHRELKDTFFELGLLDIISWLYQIHGNTEKRVEYTNQRLELAQKTGYHMNVADATAILGFADEMAGRYAAAESKYEQALPVYQEYDDRYHYAEYLSQLAGLVLLKGELTRARELIEEAEFLARQMSSPVVQNVPYGTLGMIHNLEEDYAEAIRQTNKIPDALTTQSFVFYRPKGLAYAQCGLGDFSSAQRYLSEAFETAVKTKATGWQVQCLPAAALISASEDQLERATELLSLAYHHPVGETGWLEKFPLVTHLRERLERELSPAAFQESWNHGRRLSHSETVAALKDELAGMGWGLPAGAQQKIRHNLPVQRTSFIGRVAEIERVTSLLGQASLVTLTGVGGTGKTRLALQAVSDVLEDYPNGTWFVELAQLADPAMVPKTVAKTLGLVETPGKPIADTVVDFLESRAVLLVLDNCEHLLGSCASLVDRVLNDCPRITVLATSREILGVIGEVPFLVPPLSMPEDHTDLSVDTLCDCDAVTLFVERARVVTPDFDLSDENAAVIVEVVRRLDGIPLAIELAAARLRLLGVEQLAQRLNDAFRLLTGGSRTALPRQQTLRASIDWSYNLLSDPERLLLRRLSVFAGRWSLGAAEVVCADEPGPDQAIQPEDILDLLSELVDKSLITSVSGADGRNRFYMLETIRQYAHEKLVDEGEAETLRTRHLAYYLELAETLEPKLRGREQIQTLDRLGLELDNIRLALEWGLQTDVEVQLQLAVALMWFWTIRFHWSECIDWLEKGLALEPATRPASTAGQEFHQTPSALIRAKALKTLGFLRNIQFYHLKARPVLEESLGIYRQAGIQDNRDMAYVLFFLGGTLYGGKLAEESEIRAYADEAMGIFHKINDPYGTAVCLQLLGRMATNPVRDGEIQQEALAIVEAIGDVDGIATTLHNIGWAAHDNGDYAKTLSAYEASREQSLLVNNRNQEGWTNLYIGVTSQELGDFQRADRYIDESLAIASEIGNEIQIPFILYDKCMLRIAEGHHTQADEITSEMWRIFQKTGRNYIAMGVLIIRARLARLRGDRVQAREYAQEALTFTEDIGFYLKTQALIELGHLALQDGDLKQAGKLWREGIRILKHERSWAWLKLSLDAMAVLALREGKPAQAARLFGTRWSRGGYHYLSPDERTQRDADLADLREAMGDERFEGLYAEGQTMSLEDAVAYALEENDG